MKTLGKYEILEEIGRGGFAVVYKARDPQLDRLVALKVLYPHWSNDPSFVARFQREARAVANLDHPNIVTVYETGEAEGQLYIAMKYLPGRTLQAFLEDKGPLSLTKAQPILEGVAAALDYAHRRGVVHRDVKPSNIIVEETTGGPQVTLTDFGLVKALEGTQALTATGALLGSPEYMAPEQADPVRANEVGPASDRYALGVVAYQMLSGRVPFPGNTPGTLNAHLNLDPPDPQTVCEDISSGVAAVLLKMLSKARAERFPSAQAFVEQLLAPQTTLPAVHLPALSGRAWMIGGLILLVSLFVLLWGGGGFPVGLSSEDELGTEENPIIMSFVPLGDTQEILDSGEELVEMISEKTGLVIEANVGTDFAAVREAMGAEKAHIGWLSTFNYVLANEKYGVEVGLVTERYGVTSYRGQINVRADSGIESLEDLKGKVMCWVDSNSTSGYIIPRIILKTNGIDPDTDFTQTVETGSHENVITQVYDGDCDAGATYDDARSSVEEDLPDVREKVVVLITTTDIPNDSVSFTKDFPEEMREDIINALLEIAQSEEGQQVLNGLYSIAGLQKAEDSFYDALRADLNKAGMDIEELVE